MTKGRTRAGPGLRLQIVLALAGVVLVAYVPLFFAIAQITRATSAPPRREDRSGSVERASDEDASARTAQLVRAVALYMSLFALALLVFAYIVLTRAIVRPIEQLSRAADRVANGARDLELPVSAAREVADLGSSLRAMTSRLRDDEQALRLKVDELTATTKRLFDAREQLAGSERMASVGRLAAGVAHEIGNPIAAIMGMHDLIQDEAIPDEARADFLMRMRRETERIHVVVRDLLDYARPESIPESARTVTWIAEVIDDVLGLVRPQKEFKSIETKLEVEPDLAVTLSAQRLTQVLLNLLLNAGAALGATPNPRTIVVRARQADSVVRIEVEDNGPGVPGDVAPRIFDPFVTTKDVGAGTGLGLAVCRGIVEGAGGRIVLDATFEEGARFVVELPSGSAPSL